MVKACCPVYPWVSLVCGRIRIKIPGFGQYDGDDSISALRM